MKKVTFKISGMNCTACAMNIDFDLEDLSGVKSSKTSYAKQVTEIEFDESKIREEVLIESIKKTGYQVKTA